MRGAGADTGVKGEGTDTRVRGAGANTVVACKLDAFLPVFVDSCWKLQLNFHCQGALLHKKK